MASKKKQTENAIEAAAPVQSISEQAAATQGPEGVIARRAFMPRFLLGPEANDWIMKNVVGEGKDAKGQFPKVVVGRVFGMITGSELKVNDHNGKALTSIVLYGLFEYESVVTGELGQASSCYLPMSYAEGVRAAMVSDPTLKGIEMDLDLGLQATGKTIPYEWLVVNYTSGQAGVLQRMRATRRPGSRAIAGPAAPAQIAAPVQEEGDSSKGAEQHAAE